MDDQKIKNIVQQELRQWDSANRFRINSMNRHIHNNVDSPFVFLPYSIYTGCVPYLYDITPGVNEANGLRIILPQDWSVYQAYESVQFTATPLTGATSGTLTKVWDNVRATGYSLFITFSISGNQFTTPVTVTNGSASVTWTDALPGDSDSVNALVLAIGQYTVIHNLGSTGYSVVATAQQGTNEKVVPVVTSLDNQFDIYWFDLSGEFKLTSFDFILMQINNKSATFPSYQTINVR